MDKDEAKCSSVPHKVPSCPKDVAKMSTMELLQNPQALSTGVQLMSEWCNEKIEGEELGKLLGITDPNTSLSNEDGADNVISHTNDEHDSNYGRAMLRELMKRCQNIKGGADSGDDFDCKFNFS